MLDVLSVRGRPTEFWMFCRPLSPWDYFRFARHPLRDHQAPTNPARGVRRKRHRCA